MSEQKQVKPWYKHIWPWVLMVGSIFVVIASVSMFFVAKEHAIDLVTNDYYKDGKHIDIQLHRDEEAVKRHIQVQVLISPDKDAAKVFDLATGRSGSSRREGICSSTPTRR